MRASIQVKCSASQDRDGVVLICHRSRGHSVLTCFDADENRHFIVPDRVGFPKIQPLGIRKLRPIAAQLDDALKHLRKLLEFDRAEVLDDVTATRRYLSLYVEGPLAEALGAIDPKFRIEEWKR